MKQAILVISYQNIFHLIDLVDFLSDGDFCFYIHIDKKSKIDQGEIEKLKSKDCVCLISRKYKINWGGFNLTKAILYLVGEASRNKEIEYMHLISGADFPIKNSAEISQSLAKNQGKEFIENFKMLESEWANYGMNRIEYYHFTDLFNIKSGFGRKVSKFLFLLQRKFNLKRKINSGFPTLYGGSTWWTLSTPCLKYVLEYIKGNPDFVNRFKYTLIADEIFFQTIIMNSPFNKNVMPHNYRFILWNSETSSHPDVLNEMDLSNLLQSDKLFARKFNYPESQKLAFLLKSKI